MPDSARERSRARRPVWEDRMSIPIRYVRGVGEKRAKDFERMGVETLSDLLYHVPRAYEDRRDIKPIALIMPGERETIRGTVIGVKEIRPNNRIKIVKAIVWDGTGTASLVWYNQPYMMRRFRRGMRVIATAKVEARFGELQLSTPEWEEAEEEEPLNMGRIVPIYRLSGRLSQSILRGIVKMAIDGYLPFGDPLPQDIRDRHGLLGFEDAIRQIHFPDDLAQVEIARRRLAFEELFVLQLALGFERKRFKSSLRGIAHQKDGDVIRRFEGSLPFDLTLAQKRAIEEIRRDMEAFQPMSRLLQGDVGSGKTVVAAWALAKAVDSGHQGALMAPTELLAEQHFHTIRGLLESLGITVELLIGRVGTNDRNRILQGLSNGEIQVVIGTHALIQEDVKFKDLSVVITDEQHRFGVRQRARLQEKSAHPDVLVMSATPIPRTLALTVYGDLDISVLDELPAGRGSVVTRWLRPGERRTGYERIRARVREGRQAYVVCPLIEESDQMEAEAATKLVEELRKGLLKEFRIGVIHGKQKAQERESTMRSFRDGHIDVLVATSVIEVGIDVPNAVVILVEDAERFGLAQLHQLRGRIARSEHQAECLLVGRPGTPEGVRRLEVMMETSDGFAIAEEDLKLRGPGEFRGTRQHGMPDFKVANPVRDLPLLELTRGEAMNLLERDPELTDPTHSALRRRVSHLIEQWSEAGYTC